MTNNECRCSRCGALLAKRDEAGRITMIRHSAEVTFEGEGSASITCYWKFCKQVTRFLVTRQVSCQKEAPHG